MAPRSYSRQSIPGTPKINYFEKIGGGGGIETPSCSVFSLYQHHQQLFILTIIDDYVNDSPRYFQPNFFMNIMHKCHDEIN